MCIYIYILNTEATDEHICIVEVDSLDASFIGIGGFTAKPKLAVVCCSFWHLLSF